MKPLKISDDEELERISAMIQRDNLVRGLGVVDAVYRLLQSSPGATSLTKNTVNQVAVSPFWSVFGSFAG